MNSDMQLRIVEQAVKDGLNPNYLTPAQFTHLSLKARSAKEAVQAAASALTSVARGVAGFVVSPEKTNQNKNVCLSNKCGKLKILKGGTIGCSACGCCGALLSTRWRDKRESCPLGFWSNKE